MLNVIMKKSSFFKIPGVVLLLILSYYSLTVIIAREKTPRIVEDILQSDMIQLQLSNLSPRQIEVLITVEDPNFFNHRGVDLRTPGAGLTTITQGLVKRLYFKDFKPGIRKIKQTLIARFVLDPLVSKEDQLLMFINIFDFCYGTKGLSQAAEFYYGKPFTSLTEDEYLSLVAMFVGCSAYNPIHNAAANAERVARIKKVLSGEYVVRKMKDIYYSDEKDAFRMKR